MTTTPKQIGQKSVSPCRLVRALIQLSRSTTAGQESAEFVERVEALILDRSEVAAMYQWLKQIEAFQTWVELKRKRDRGIRRELKRKDLTIAEAVRLCKLADKAIEELNTIDKLADYLSL